MPLIKWRDSYSVGVEEMDAEHEMLVGIVNELFTIVRNHGHAKDSEICIDKLIQYTQKHFANEEKMLEETGFPLVHDHTKIHGNLLNTVTIFKGRITDKEEMVTEELYLFLRDWLLTHILEEDMKYKEHIQLSKVA